MDQKMMDQDKQVCVWTVLLYFNLKVQKLHATAI